jgi:hypothetical protein
MLILVGKNNESIKQYYKMIGIYDNFITMINTNYYISKSKISLFNNLIKETKNNLMFYDNKIIVCRIVKDKKIKYEIINFDKYFTKYFFIKEPLYFFNLNEIFNFDRISKNVNINGQFNDLPLINNNIFVIHNNKNIERKNHVEKLKQLFLQIYVVDAIFYNENEKLEDFCSYVIYKNIYENNKFNYDFTLGAVGLTLSNLLIFNYALEHKMENIMIFEDDVLIHKNINELLITNLQNLPENYDVVLLGKTQQQNIKQTFINEYFYKRNYSWGTFAYVIMNIEKIKNKFEKFEEPIDNYKSNEYKIGVCKNDLFIVDLDLGSDIQNKIHNYSLWNWNKKLFF